MNAIEVYISIASTQVYLAGVRFGVPRVGLGVGFPADLGTSASVRAFLGVLYSSSETLESKLFVFFFFCGEKRTVLTGTGAGVFFGVACAAALGVAALEVAS